MDSGDFSLPHAPLLAAPDSQFLSPASIASLSLCLPASPSSKPDYVTHLVSLQRGAPSGQLLALTSGGHCHLVDKRTLQRTDTWEVIKDGSSAAAKDGFCSIKLTNAAKMDDGSFWGVTDRTGTCTIFDDRSGAQTRKQSVTIDTPTNSALLSLAFSPPGANGFSAAPLVALGHELQSLDAPIYLYDLRNPAAPVLTYDQSHSDDVTFLDLSAFPLLLSGSTDGLMTVFDTTKGSDEDEAVLSAVNTGSSIARGAWQVGPPQDWRIGLFARAQESQWQVDLQGTLGKVWAASDMQTVGVWDAGSTDPLMPPLSALPSSTLLPANSAWKSRQWETDYIVDAFARPLGGLCVVAGDQSGAFSLISVPEAPAPFCGDPQRQEAAAKVRPWTLDAFFPSKSDSVRGGHEDIVRAVVLEDVPTGSDDDGKDATSLVWSGGEDGRIVLWDMTTAARGVSSGGNECLSAFPRLVAVGRRTDDMAPMFGRSSGPPGRRGAYASASPGVGNGGRFKPYG